MTPETWYPINENFPPAGPQIRAIVTFSTRRGEYDHSYDAQIIVSRGRAPHSDKWLEWKGKNFTPLADNATPCLWQPQYPEKWRAPLPSPVSSVSPRLWSSRLTFEAVNDAEGYELASEMESDREMARVQIGTKVLHIAKEKPAWWRDASGLRYEPPGAITERQAEWRIMRAVALCEHGRELTIRANSFSAILARMAARHEEKQNSEPALNDFVPRLQSLPSDIADFQTAMSWFVALNPILAPRTPSEAWDFSKDQNILLYRSYNNPLSFDVIGGMREWRCTGEGARKHYIRVIKRVTEIANSVDPPPAAAQIAALKDRNLDFHNSGHCPTAINVRALAAMRKA